MPWKPNAWSLFWLTGPERGWVAGPASSDSAYSSSWRPRAPSRGASRIQKSESSPLAGLGARADSLFSLLTRSHASMYRLRSSALAFSLLIARGVGMGTSGRVFLVTDSVDLVLKVFPFGEQNREQWGTFLKYTFWNILTKLLVSQNCDSSNYCAKMRVRK